MRTETAFSNDIYAAVYDGAFNILAEGNITLDLSAAGAWYNITLDPAIEFAAGSSFYLEISTNFSFIPYPAGIDVDAAVKGQSFYFDGTQWADVNLIAGFENAAFVLRASGTYSGGGGENPITISPSNGSLGGGQSQSITVSLNAQNIQEGTYVGQVNVNTNGGNFVIPIDVLVDVEK